MAGEIRRSATVADIRRTVAIVSKNLLLLLLHSTAAFAADRKSFVQGVMRIVAAVI